jgi:hypothetical protein
MAKPGLVLRQKSEQRGEETRADAAQLFHEILAEEVSNIDAA